VIAENDDTPGENQDGDLEPPQPSEEAQPAEPAPVVPEETVEPDDK